MADEIDELLAAKAGDDSDVDDLLRARAGETPTVQPSKFHEPTAAELKDLKTFNEQSQDLPWYQRAAQGVNDPIIGAGQLMQHIVPDAVLNAGRKVTDPIVNAVMGGPPQDTSKTSSADFDQLVRNREQKYQAERSGAGQEGLDWNRIGGTVANPMSWLAPEGSGAGVLAAVGNGAKQGLFQALMQPVTSQGSFLWNKGVQEAVGAVAGGTVGAALHALKPVWSLARDKLAGVFKGADEATQQAAAGKVVDDTLKATGADPAKVDPNLYAAIKQEVGDALKIGAEPDPKIMANRADAAALPVPIQLTRGQASRDPMQFSWEVNNSKLQGAGQPIQERLQQQNRQLIENLNELGAARAPAPFDASQKIIGTIQAVDAKAKAAVDQAYSAVRNSAGQPALMDRSAFQQAARGALEKQQLTEFIPDSIKAQYNALATGQVPLTVDTMQVLDRVWSAEQRAAKGSAQMAIGELRKALNDAPVTDQLGEQAVQAYKVARQLAAQRFGVMEANPAYKAVVDGVEPDKFFQKYVAGANVSELAGLKQLIGPENTAMLQDTLVGNLKKIALNRASDDNGVFSQAAYNKVLQDPVQAPRLQELFKDVPEKLGALYRVGRVAENVVAFPKGHSVNTSNTAPTVANLMHDMAKSEAGSAFWSGVGRVIAPARAEVLKQAGEKRAISKAVDEAMSPGVTRGPLKAVAPSAKTQKLTSLLPRTAAAYAVDETDE